MKRKLLGLLMLFAFGYANAQIIDIPDAAFKQYLLNYQDDVFYPENQLIDTNQDGEIQVSEAEAIEILSIVTIAGNDPILSLQGIEAFVNLTTMQIAATMADIDLSAQNSLSFLYITGPALQNLTLPQAASLTQLNLAMSAITSLDVSPQSNLTLLQLTGLDELTSLTVGANTALNIVTIGSASLQEVDLSECPNINSINLSFDVTAHDVYINLKNGNSNYVSPPSIFTFSEEDNGYKCFVCIDEDERAQFPEELADGIYFSTYCSFTPGGDYNTISGAFSYDTAADGCDDGDVFSGFTKVSINDGADSGTVFTSITGDYAFYTQAGAFNLTPELDNDWFTVNPLTPTVTFADNDNNETEQNFCVSAIGEHNDMEVVVYPVTVAQPGFNATYRVVCRNSGNMPMTGYFTLTYDDAVFDFVQSNTAVSASPGSITWGYTDLLPFQTRTVFVTLNLNSPTEDPAVNFDDELMLSVALGSVANDENPDNNSYTLYQSVVGSYDPNDITCVEGEALSPEMIGEYLHYNVRFENTGTAPATFVVVKDTFNEEQFDVSSLEVLYASHPMQARLTGNVVEFYFDNINLAANGGKGNVLFKIRSLETLTENDFVAQEAAIYFDYNWPVITNEYVTTFDALSIDDFAANSSLKIFPNPTSGVVNISSNNEISIISVYDIQGRLLQDVNVNAVDATVSLESNPSGVYLLKINGLKGSATLKVVKQ